MKKLILLTAFVIVAGAAIGQSLQKGNLIGVHLMDAKFNPDVTYNQYKDFILNRYISEFEKVLQGDCNAFILEGIRGENKNEVGVIFVFKSEAARDKYYDEKIN